MSPAQQLPQTPEEVSTAIACLEGLRHDWRLLARDGREYALICKHCEKKRVKTTLIGDPDRYLWIKDSQIIAVYTIQDRIF